MTKSNHRRSIRLKHYDYTSSGAYFVTICTQNRAHVFGDFVDGEMRLNDFGNIVQSCWGDIPTHFLHTQLDEFVVMPNHIHGILVIVGARHAVPQQNAVPQRYGDDVVDNRIEQFGKPISGSLPTIIRSFKSATTKFVGAQHAVPQQSIWQRNYYERVVRNDDELNRIRGYILNNPINWKTDDLYPNNQIMEAVA